MSKDTQIIFKKNLLIPSELLDIIPIPIFYKDINGNLLGYNQEFLRLFESDDLSALVNKNVAEIFPPETTKQFLQKDQGIIQKESHVQMYNAKIITSLGKEKNIIIFSSIFGENHDQSRLSSEGIIGVVFDVSMLNEKVIHYSKLASIGCLAAGVAHEINNPLTIVQGFWDILHDMFKEKQIIDEESSEHFYNGQQALSRIKNIITGLIEFARHDNTPEKPTDLFKAITSSVGICENIYIKDKVAIEVKFSEQAEKQGIIVFGNFGRLQQIFIGLLSSSYQTIKEKQKSLKGTDCLKEFIGKIKLYISVDDQRPQNVIVQLSDNGIGIKEAKLKEILSQFITNKCPGESSMPELFTAYSIVKAMGGEIKIESTYREETSITITLPLKVP
ncbi:MAG: hypothetical protein HQK53_01960 [Oligoflexia bacterium]|nr:hypothetical protein [Oligoflexia bacterium]